MTDGQARKRKALEEKLQAHFVKVRRDVFQNHLAGITDARVLTGYIENHYPREYAAHGRMWKDVLRKVSQQIAEKGALELVTYAPVYKCWQDKPSVS